MGRAHVTIDDLRRNKVLNKLAKIVSKFKDERENIMLMYMSAEKVSKLAAGITETKVIDCVDNHGDKVSIMCFEGYMLEVASAMELANMFPYTLEISIVQNVPGI